MRRIQKREKGRERERESRIDFGRAASAVQHGEVPPLPLHSERGREREGEVHLSECSALVLKRMTKEGGDEAVDGYFRAPLLIHHSLRLS